MVAYVYIQSKINSYPAIYDLFWFLICLCQNFFICCFMGIFFQSWGRAGGGKTNKKALKMTS